MINKILVFAALVLFGLVNLGDCNQNKAVSKPQINETFTNRNESENTPEVINKVENEGNPLEFVINVGPAYSPNYVTLGQSTVVGLNSEIPIFITVKNIDLLPYEEAVKQNKSSVVITVNEKSWLGSYRNPLPDSNTINYSIETNPSQRVSDVTIEKVFNKKDEQILRAPVTFTLKLPTLPQDTTTLPAAVNPLHSSSKI